MPRGAPRKPHTRTIDKIHILVRLELANPILSMGEIAQLANIDYNRFIRLKRLPVFKQIHNQYLTGVLTKLDNKYDQQLKLTQETMQFAVPIAMQALVKQALQDKNMRIQNKACNDILDRDGHFAKVQRIGLPTREQGGVAEDADNKAAAELLQAIKDGSAGGAAKRPLDEQPPATDTIQ